MGNDAMPFLGGNEQGGWKAYWYRQDDILIVEYHGYFSDTTLNQSLDYLTSQFEQAGGDLRIYTISLQSAVTEISPTLTVTAALHHGFFHPRAGKLYVVGDQHQRELHAMNELLNARRPDSVRFAESIEAAAADIDARRAVYRQQTQPLVVDLPDGTFSAGWHRPNDIALLRYEGYMNDAVLSAALDALKELLDSATGTLKIYMISDQSAVTNYSPNVLGQAVLHPVVLHPRYGKLYVVAGQREQQSMNAAINSHFQDAVRFADSVEAATEQIEQRRAAYWLRKTQEIPLVDGWLVEWFRPNEIIFVRYSGMIDDTQVNDSMNKVETFFNQAGGQGRIDIIIDDTHVSGFNPALNAQIALHSGFFHPRAGKLYIIGASLELRSVLDALNTRRAGMLQFVDSIEEAVSDMSARRQP